MGAQTHIKMSVLKKNLHTRIIWMPAQITCTRFRIVVTYKVIITHIPNFFYTDTSVKAGDAICME